MNNDYIYIADNNNTDMFDIEIPAFDTGSEIPPPPDFQNQPSEMQNFAAKSFTSFGAMFVCIAIFLIIVWIIKKKKAQTNSVYENEEEPGENYEQIEEAEPEEPVQAIKKSSNLNTPSSIHKCILSFLENTKEN